MSTLPDFGDDLGPAKVIHVRQPAIGLRAVLVVDNVARGPAIGGLRMAPDVTVEACSRLARAMTLKKSAAGLAHSALGALKAEGRSVLDYGAGSKLGVDDILGIDCDIWIPAARPDVVRRRFGLL